MNIGGDGGGDGGGKGVNGNGNGHGHGDYGKKLHTAPSSLVAHKMYRERLPYIVGGVIILLVALWHSSSTASSSSSAYPPLPSLSEETADEQYEYSTAASPAAIHEMRRTGLLARLQQVASLEDELTPQGRAFAWLLDEDKRQLSDDAPHVEQRFALATLFFALSGKKWVHGELHWMKAVHECQWHKKIKGGRLGVRECDANQEVTYIYLAANGLEGQLPPEVGLLTQLEKLHINDNDITGTLPEEWSQLTNLRELMAFRTKLEGNIPESFSQLSHLHTLHLQMSQMHGTVPDAVCNMMKPEISPDTKLIDLEMDCKEDVECECCTVCCSHTEHCGPTS